MLRILLYSYLGKEKNMQKSKDKFVPLHDDLMFKYIFGYQENSKFIIDLLEEFFNVDKGVFKNR